MSKAALQTAIDSACAAADYPAAEALGNARKAFTDAIGGAVWDNPAPGSFVTVLCDPTTTEAMVQATHVAAPELGFFGVTPVARPTVNWLANDDPLLIQLIQALIALGLIDGQELQA